MAASGLTISGWFAGVLIANFVAKARSIMEDNHRLQVAASNMLYRVEAALPRIKIHVEVIERKAINPNARLPAWLKQFKDAVYEAEDLLDDLEIKRIQETMQSRVSSAVSFVRNIVLSDTDLQRFELVLTKLDSITSGITFPDMRESSDAEEVIVHRLEKQPAVVVGRDEEKQHLMNMIFPPRDGAESSTGVSVISVVGAAGVGKTTLAQVIYNDPCVKEAFLLRGWVFTSRSCSRMGLEQDIIDSFASEQEENLQRKSVSSESSLIDVIQNKKFFLVIDNVQDNLHHQWGPLMTTLARGAHGSVVLLTSQSEEVANSFEATSQIPLAYLPSPVLWRVFEHHAFGNHKRAQSLESIGKNLVQNLHGLPLLAEAVGRFLRQRLDQGNWEKISSSPWWLLSKDEHDLALPSVGIMCEHLSDDLRKCLCYCSIFPPGYLFEKNMLIHMWIASFTHQHDGIGLDDIEKEWFNELFSLSFFQSTIWKNRYVMPDMIREPLCVISDKECHAASDSREHKRCLQEYRHLSINLHDFNVHLNLRENNKLRSILFFDGCRTTSPDQAFNHILLHPTSLRVLDFSYTEARQKALDFIKKFTSLRFLDLSFTGLTTLPDSLCELNLLQVLGLRGCHFEMLPTNINMLVNLRFLYAEARTVSLIYKIGQLTNLQGLEEFPVGRNKITELKDLNEISGQLCIGNLENIASTDIVDDAKLFKKRHLKKLVLKWGWAACDDCPPEPSYCDNCTKTLNGLKDSCTRTLLRLKPNSNLEKLIIQRYMGVLFPGWMTEVYYFTELRHIHLIECKLLPILPALGRLPSLVILIIKGLSALKKIGDEFYGTSYNVFRSLEELEFLNMPNWEEWSGIERRQSFRKLKKVRIDGCPKLTEAPLKSFKTTLLELVLADCGPFLANGRCLEGFTKLKRLTISKYPDSVILPCSSLTSLEVLKVLNERKSEPQFDGGKQLLSNIKMMVINNRVQVFSDETNFSHQVSSASPIIREIGECSQSASVSTVGTSCSGDNDQELAGDIEDSNNGDVQRGIMHFTATRQDTIRPIDDRFAATTSDSSLEDPKVSAGEIVAALKKIPGLYDDDDAFLNAYDFLLSDDRKFNALISLSMELRKKWLSKHVKQ